VTGRRATFDLNARERQGWRDFAATGTLQAPLRDRHWGERKTWIV